MYALQKEALEIPPDGVVAFVHLGLEVILNQFQLLASVVPLLIPMAIGAKGDAKLCNCIVTTAVSLAWIWAVWRVPPQLRHGEVRSSSSWPQSEQVLMAEQFTDRPA